MGSGPGSSFGLERRSATYGSWPKFGSWRIFSGSWHRFRNRREKKQILTIFFSRGHQHKGKIKKQHKKKENNSLFWYFFFLKVHLLCIEITAQSSASWIYLTLSNNTTFSSHNILKGKGGPLGSWLGAWDFHWVTVKKGCRQSTLNLLDV